MKAALAALLLIGALLAPMVAPAPASGAAVSSQSSVAARRKLAATLRYSQHAVKRMQERGVPVTDVRRTVESGEMFRFYHDGKWKSGFYDPGGRLFVSTDGRMVITVIADATRKYIDNLKSKSPPP